jgi:hypothetical protein
MEQQASRGIAGVDMRIEDLQMHLLAVEFRGDLAAMAVQEGTFDSTPFGLSPGATIAYRPLPLLTAFFV